ncbi:MAG: outer membrane protein assembly factor BamB family protein, partial [Planctomycetota bacterium]
MRALSFLCLLPVLSTPLFAQATSTWPQFLGEGSIATANGAQTLSFDRENDLRYRVEIPAGESSPCIWGDHIFLTGVDADQLVMFALDRASGKELWRHGVPAPTDYEFMHADANMAMPTACTNGERVFFYLPSYGLIARDMDGELVWEKRLPDPKPDFGIGSSPLLYQGMVILLRDGCPDAALYALEEETGEELWTLPRIAFSDSHTTPFIWENRDRIELIIASSGTVASHDLDSGEEIWRVDGLTPLVCTTPTASIDRLYFAGWSTPAALGADKMLAGMENPIELSAEERGDPELLFKRFDSDGDGSITFDEIPAGRAKAAYGFLDASGDGGISLEEWTPFLQMPVMGKNMVVAIRAGGEGNVTESHVEWTGNRGIPYVSSPLLYDN